MPKKKGETTQQHMDRLRAVRGLPPLRDKMMLRAQAAVCIIDTMSEPAKKRARLHAFLSIFHPEIPADKAAEMARTAYRE